MPPEPFEYQGRAAIARFLSTVPAGGELNRFRLVPTRANGQAAFGFYLEDSQCPIARATGVMVLTLRGGHVSAMAAFHDMSVVPYFGLPRTLRVAPGAPIRHTAIPDTAIRPLYRRRDGHTLAP